MLALDAPLTPDGDEAQSWVTEELSHPEYGDEASPLTRGIRWLLRAFIDALGGGTGSPPVAAIVLVTAIIVLALVAIIVVRNPIRITGRGASAQIFDGEETTREDAHERARSATRAGDWDSALVWTFRVLVLDLAARGIVRDGPGLTAREASTQASTRITDRANDLEWAAGIFDRIRYGTLHAESADVERMDHLVGELEMAPVGAPR